MGQLCKPDSDRGRMAREFLHEPCLNPDLFGYVWTGLKNELVFKLL